MREALQRLEDQQHDARWRVCVHAELVSIAHQSNGKSLPRLLDELAALVAAQNAADKALWDARDLARRIVPAPVGPTS